MDNFYESFLKSDLAISKRTLYTPSEFAIQTLYYVQEAGTLKSLKAHCCKRDYLDSFLFLIVLSGSGVLFYDNKEYILQKSDMVLIDCKKPYFHQCNENDQWELMWVHFNGISAQGYFNYFSKNTDSVVLSPDSTEDFIKLVMDLVNKQSMKNFSTEIICSSIITQLLALIFMSLYHKQQASHNTTIQFEQIREYLSEHFQEELNLNILADKYNLSVGSMNCHFEKYYGITIKKYILSRRLTQAKELLRFTMDSLLLISQSCGFTSQEEFERIFEEVVGVSPLQYKMRW